MKLVIVPVLMYVLEEKWVYEASGEWVVGCLRLFFLPLLVFLFF